MKTREKLPNRRNSVVFKLPYRLGNEAVHMHVNFSCYKDGRVAEAFINTKKQGTIMSGILRDAACIISIALQFGTPFETLRSAVTRDENGISAASPIGAVLDEIERIRKEAI
jgi:hypothetical protein